MRHRPVGSLLLPLLLLHGCGVASAPSQRIRVMAAEDRRAAADGDLEILAGALRSADAAVRSTAVRAMGRLEKPAHLPAIARLLRDDDAPTVRSEAAWAAAQAMRPGPGIDAAGVLLASLTEDVDGSVRGAAALSLGRLSYASTEQVGAVLAALLEATHGHIARDDTIRADSAPSDLRRAGDADEATLLGALRGIEALMRTQPPAAALLHPSAADRMRELIRYQGDDALAAGRVRSLALMVLIRQGVADGETLNAAMSDPEAEVRRLGASGIPQAEDEWRAVLVDRGNSDPDPRVRLATLRAWMPRTGELDACGDLGTVVDDRDPHVRLQAIDALRVCPDAAPRLVALASADSPEWQSAAHALVALAALDPPRAARLVGAFAGANRWQSRMYGARAAASVGDPATLIALAADPHPNVREAALRGLTSLAGADTEDQYLAALASDAPQVLMAAAEGLAAARRPAVAAQALLDALDRMSALGRETDRDARIALLGRAGALADVTAAERVDPYLADFDPVIATKAAEVLEQWTGEPRAAQPRPLPPQPLPTESQLDQMAAARVTVSMQRGTTFELRLFPWDAPTNVARFVALARAGRFDGLTFHRVVPNFVIQGGSPGANEFAGHGAYTRDELTARSHLRGTVGISTRGRDTGDGQIFVNLVDNVRLDNDYTIIAEVIDGIDTIDAVLEGDVIASVTVSGSRP